MTTIILTLGVVLVFFIGLVSPHLANKIERKTNKKAARLKRIGNWFWDPITWWVKTSTESSRKVITITTEWGKKTRKAVKSNKKNP